ncbi:MAG: calcium-binding protein [Phycisphaerae bacterium]
MSYRTANRSPSAKHVQAVETLENRRHLAVTAAAFHETLYVWGDANPNAITVDLDSATGELFVETWEGRRWKEIFRVAEDEVVQIRMYGYEGNDALKVGTFVTTHAVLMGGSGADYLKLGNGTGQLYGHGIWNGPGSDDHQLENDDHADDILYTGRGAAVADGQGGNDRIYQGAYGTGHQMLIGGPGHDRFYTSDTGTSTWIDGGEGNDTWYPKADRATKPVTFVGGPGHDSAFYGQWDKDVWLVSDGVNYSGLKDGNRPHLIHADVEALHGGSGHDVLIGSNKNDFLYGNGGNDTIIGLGGDDSIYGGSGDDLIYAGEGDDYVDAGWGNDTVYAGGGNDTLFGNQGNDVLFGEAGDDVLEGGDGIDLLNGGPGNDTYL